MIPSLLPATSVGELADPVPDADAAARVLPGIKGMAGLM